MLDILKGAKKFSLYMGIASLVVGLVLLVFPAVTVKTICVLIGVLCIAGGVALIISFVMNHSSLLSSLAIVPGVLLLLFGIFLCVRSEAFVSAMQVILGVYLIVKGIGDLFKSFEVRRFGGAWWLGAVTAGLVVLAGFLIVFNPFDSALAVTRLTGAAFAVYGIIDIFVYFRFKRAERDAENAHGTVYTQMPDDSGDDRSDR